jgi:hypothetical protein
MPCAGNTDRAPDATPRKCVAWSSVLSGTSPPAPIATRYRVIVGPACRGAWRTYLGGIDHGGGGCCTAPALPPNAIMMEAFPLRAAAYDERLTLTRHLSELRAWLLVTPAVYQASIALLRLNERRGARHEPLSG